MILKAVSCEIINNCVCVVTGLIQSQLFQFESTQILVHSTFTKYVVDIEEVHYKRDIFV